MSTSQKSHHHKVDPGRGAEEYCVELRCAGCRRARGGAGFRADLWTRRVSARSGDRGWGTDDRDQLDAAGGPAGA